MPEIDTNLEEKKDNTKEPKDPRQGLPPNVVVSEGNAAFTLDSKKRKDPKNQYIKYNGVGTVRVITPSDWKKAGIECDSQTEWNYLNKMRLPRSAFTDEQLQYLLRVDGRFELVTEE